MFRRRDKFKEQLNFWYLTRPLDHKASKHMPNKCGDLLLSGGPAIPIAKSLHSIPMSSLRNMLVTARAVKLLKLYSVNDNTL